MKKITAIEPQKYNPRRVNIHLDGEFAFGLSAIVAAWLKVGQPLEDARAAELKAQDQREEAMQRALRSLGRRARTEVELRASLAKAEIGEDVICATLARLKELNLLDDAAFARSFISDRQRFRPRGKRLMSLELRQKGVDAATAAKALEEQVDDAAEALSAAQQAARRYKALPWPEFKQKMAAWLLRRGFGWQDAGPAVRAAWQTLHPGNAGAGQQDNFEIDEEDV